MSDDMDDDTALVDEASVNCVHCLVLSSAYSRMICLLTMSLRQSQKIVVYRQENLERKELAQIALAGIPKPPLTLQAWFDVYLLCTRLREMQDGEERPKVSDQDLKKMVSDCGSVSATIFGHFESSV
jgi:hypothetical protein